MVWGRGEVTWCLHEHGSDIQHSYLPRTVGMLSNILNTQGSPAFRVGPRAFLRSSLEYRTLRSDILHHGIVFEKSCSGRVVVDWAFKGARTAQNAVRLCGCEYSKIKRKGKADSCSLLLEL
jgi:hypothetical protein